MAAIASMTGHGTGRSRSEAGSVTVEITTVNRRQFDLHVQWPPGWAVLEADTVRAVREHLHRGRIQVGVRWEGANGGAGLDAEAARGWLEGARRLGASLGVEDDLRLSQVLRFLDQQGGESVPPAETVRGLFDQALAEALAACVAMRRREGELLVAELRGLMNALEPHLADIRAVLPELVTCRAEKLKARLLEAGLSEEALAPGWEREIALLADRMDVREELVRLAAHLDAVGELFDAGGELGRKLDFLLQEILREIGTLGSKCGDAAVARELVDVKALLEKMREQAQNLE